MATNIENRIISFMIDQALIKIIIVTVPDLMKGLKISRSDATAGLAVLENKKLVFEIPGRPHLWYLSEIHNVWKEAQDKKNGGQK